MVYTWYKDGGRGGYCCVYETENPKQNLMSITLAASNLFAFPVDCNVILTAISANKCNIDFAKTP